ncbi:MAG: aa3-type cytochrome c oxidase subunit IV [Rhodobiaceae bacterium]|nr:aa3-type cytochrome c oxidase subunit IV [Rhodobiaceae bacterium]
MSEGKSDSVWSDTMDAAEHERTFDGFVAFTKYGTIGCTVLLILMAVFLL